MLSIDWRPWHTAAFLEAQRRRRPVLLLLETAWAPACTHAHAHVFARPDVAAAIVETTVAVRVDADRRPDIADRYGLGQWPTLLVLTPEGQVLTGGTQLGDTLAARIRDAALAFAGQDGRWVQGAVESPGPSPSQEGIDDASALAALAETIRTTRDPRTGACLQGEAPSAGAALFALAQATVCGDPEWASMAADTIDALAESVPEIDETGLVALALDGPGSAVVARLEDQAEWTRLLARAVGLERLPGWTRRLDRLVHGLRHAYRRDDGHWRPWLGAPTGLTLVEASAQACRALLAGAEALQLPDLAREAIDGLEVLAPLAYARGSGVAHVISDRQARGPMLLDDAMLLAHALLDADPWRDDAVYRDLAEELLLTTLVRQQQASGAITDRVAALAGAGRVGRLAEPCHSLAGNAAAARLLRRLFPDDVERAAQARRILCAVTGDAVAAGPFAAPVALAWHAIGPAGAVIAAW